MENNSRGYVEFSPIFKNLLKQFFECGEWSRSFSEDKVNFPEPDGGDKIKYNAEIFGNLLFWVKQQAYMAGTCRASCFDTDEFEEIFSSFERGKKLSRREVRRLCSVVVMAMYGEYVAFGRIEPTGIDPIRAIDLMHDLADVLNDKTPINHFSRDVMEKIIADALEIQRIGNDFANFEAELEERQSKRSSAKV